MPYIGLSQIKASGDIDYEELEAYDEQLQCLISTVEGTLPGKIGRDINPSQLIQMMVSAGAKRVEVKLPVFQIVGATNVAKLVSQNVAYGGIEDD